MLYSTLVVLHWIAALVLLLEVVNRIEGCKAFERDMTPLERFSAAVKGMAYAMLGLASCGALVSPLLRAMGMPVSVWVDQVPSVSECLLYIAFATIVVRRWVACLVLEVAQARKARELQRMRQDSDRSSAHQDDGFAAKHGI